MIRSELVHSSAAYGRHLQDPLEQPSRGGSSFSVYGDALLPSSGSLAGALSGTICHLNGSFTTPLINHLSLLLPATLAGLVIAVLISVLYYPIG